MYTLYASNEPNPAQSMWNQVRSGYDKTLEELIEEADAIKHYRYVQVAAGHSQVVYYSVENP